MSQILAYHVSEPFCVYHFASSWKDIKVSKFQKKFMKSLFLPKYEPSSVTWYEAEIFTMFGSYFGRNHEFTNQFWNLLTFSREVLLYNTLFRRKTCWTNHLLLQLCHLMAFDHLDGSHVPSNRAPRMHCPFGTQPGPHEWRSLLARIKSNKRQFWTYNF